LIGADRSCEIDHLAAVVNAIDELSVAKSSARFCFWCIEYRSYAPALPRPSAHDAAESSLNSAVTNGPRIALLHRGRRRERIK
jgi:hypothetical protein